jgi:hypothetical protein
MTRDPYYGAEMLHVQWGAGQKAPMVKVISTVLTCDRAVELPQPTNAVIALSSAEREFNTAGTSSFRQTVSQSKHQKRSSQGNEPIWTKSGRFTIGSLTIPSETPKCAAAELVTWRRC